MLTYFRSLIELLHRLEQLLSLLLVYLIEYRNQILLEADDTDREPHNLEDWMDRQQVMDYLKISKSTLRRLKINNELQGRKLGGREYFFKKDIERALQISIRRGRL
jgi:hypothetical protein